jgi:hypothetical protein
MEVQGADLANKWGQNKLIPFYTRFDAHSRIGTMIPECLSGVKKSYLTPLICDPTYRSSAAAPKFNQSFYTDP